MAEERWVTRLRAELRVLPDTLVALREGVHDLRAVARRLEAVTEILERTQRHMELSGAAQFAREVDDAMVAVNSELAQIRARLPTSPTDALGALVDQTESSIERVIELAARWQQAVERRTGGDT
ncbi:MAG: hypothetical protein OES57_08175 [Acidimicrobiia bacterium]|nr:hypothetical protein [Acidimicrobiia bacterium]